MTTPSLDGDAWSIGGAGGVLPDGTFGATQDVVVQEIQAVNR
ncbi:hypothetical protein ACFYQA_21670 [Streptomyces sp. NPDC005774]